MLEPKTVLRLHIFTLSAFAFAQPLYDLLGKNAEFFPIRNNETADILALTVFLSLLVPAILVVITEAARLAGKSTWKLAHIFVVALLFVIIILPVLKEIPAITTAFTAVFALLLSATFVYLYKTKQAFQLFLTYLSPAILIFPLLFLLNSQVTYLLFPPDPPQVEVTDIKAETPIVMIIFDELPVSTLMSDKNKIDDKLFPGFAALAENSTWYTNATTVAEYTIQSIPSILTGNLPDENSKKDHSTYNLGDWMDIPTYQHYPRNLFTALGTQYELRVFETVTSLCPEEMCEHTYDYSMNLNHRLSDLLSDLFMVYLHIILPTDITKDLPRIDMGWDDFVAHNYDAFSDHIKKDDVNVFQSFIDSLTLSDRPTLYFHHTTLPHTPWKYLPSGKVYESLNLSLSKKEVAGIREPYQRHILQSMFADRLLSNAIEKLKQENIFDRSIIIVTADHGASFKHDEAYRETSQNNYADIMDVPLFIKYPGQNNAIINTNRLQLTDVIPIIFNVLDSKYPWNIDGTYPDDSTTHTSNKLPIVKENGTTSYITHNPDKKLETIEWKSKIIGNIGVSGIYGGPEHWHLIGQRINMECAREITDARIIDEEKNFSEVDLSSNKIISSIKVTTPASPLAENEVLAVSINSNIAAIITSNLIPTNTDYMYTMIDPQQIKSGDNHVNVYALDISDKCTF